MPWGTLGSQAVEILLRLRGGPQYQAQMAAAARQTRQLGGATAATGLAMRTATKRTWLMTQAIFTLRRYTFYATLAFTALAGAAIKLGISYLTAMQTARVALNPFFKSTQALKNTLDELFQISKYSPFVIADMTTAFRVLFPAIQQAGLGASFTTRLLKDMTDALSVSGKTTPAALNRVSYALQHLLYLGRLTGRQIQQLASLGIPIMPILTRQLGVTRDQLGSISKLNIDPRNVLFALMRYIETSRGFKDAALRQSLRSVHGLLQVTKDAAGQFFGIMMGGRYGESGAFKGFQSWLYNLVRRGGTLDQLQSKTHDAKSGILALSVMFTGHTGLGRGALLLADIVKNLGRVFIRVWIPALIIAMHSLIVFWPVLKALDLLLIFISHHTTTFSIILGILATYFVLTHGAMLLAWTATKLLTIATFGLISPTRKLIFWMTFEVGGLVKIARWKRIVMALTKGEIFWTGRAGKRYVLAATEMEAYELSLLATRGAIIGYIISTWGAIAATRLFSVAIFGIPLIGWALLLITVLVDLFFKWKWFHNNVIALVKIFARVFYDTMVRPVLDWIRLLTKVGRFTWAHGGHWIAHKVIPGFATGGVMPYSGPAIVGEHGAEIVNLPQGSRVTPITQTHSIDLASAVGDDKPIIVQLHVNRRVLAEEVARARQDKQARK